MKNTTVSIEGHFIWMIPLAVAMVGFAIGITSSGNVTVGKPLPPATKTCYVTEWSERQRDGQTWREPKTTICVEGEK